MRMPNPFATHDNSVVDALQVLSETGEDRRQENFYPTELELGPGCVVTGLRIRLLSREQIAAQQSEKGAVYGFVDIQIGGRIWVNSLKIYKARNKRLAVLLNPSEFNQKTERWYTDVFFRMDDREKILNEVRRILGIKTSKEQPAQAAAQ